MPLSCTTSLVDHLFRQQSGRMISTLTRILGPRQIDLAEEVVQEALIKALELWPFHGIPENPSAWLIQVARNKALDRIRRDRRSQPGAEALLERWCASEPAWTDEVLAMILLCCHPALPRESRLALTLKTVCGFSVPEIARAMLAEDAAIAQRIVRAKRQIREQNIALEMPAPPARGAPRSCARGHLPDVQRRLQSACGRVSTARGLMRRGHPSGPASGSRTRHRSTLHVRSACALSVSIGAQRRPSKRSRRPASARGSGPVALEPRADTGSHALAGPVRRRRQHERVSPASRNRRRALRRTFVWRNRLVLHCDALR